MSSSALCVRFHLPLRLFDLPHHSLCFLGFSSLARAEEGQEEWPEEADDFLHLLLQPLESFGALPCAL